MQYIEYIETDGSEICFQLTNANISTSNDIVSFDFMPLNGTTHDDGFYAFAQGSLFVRTWDGGYQVDNARYQVIFYGHSWGQSAGPVWNVNTKYECVFSDSNLVRNGTTFRYYTTQSVVTGPININGEYDGSTISRCPVGRYYRCAIERNGVLVCDYRPVLDNNNVPCFFDEVSETCCYNLGSGTPIAGPVIGPPAPTSSDLVIGNKTVDSINIGGKDVVSIYDGTTLLWEKPVKPQPTPPIVSNCVCFEAVEPNARISLQPSSNYSHFTVNLYYSTDGGTTFSPMVRQQPITLSNIGDKVYIYGENTTLAQTETNYVRLYVDGGDASVSGDLTRLLDVNGLSTLPNRALVRTLSNCSHLVDASGLTIPVTSVGERSLEGLFKDCTNLVTPPTTLPATTLGEACYEEMFSGCSSLKSAPTLPATNLATKCYNRMFYHCSSLTTAPVLLATTMMSNCYAYMFTDCTSLQTAPVLNASVLAIDCYGRMFYGCRNLNNVTCLATDISANGCLIQWMYNVAATGTFTKNPNMSNWPTGVDGIPTGWTVQDANPMTQAEYVTTSYSRAAGTFIDTGIYPTIDTVFKVKYKPIATNDTCVVGFAPNGTPTGSGSDSKDYRLFYYASLTQGTFDFNSSRINGNLTQDTDGYLHVEVGNNYIKDLNTGQTVTTGTSQSSMQTTTVPMYLDLSNSEQMHSLEIWEGQTKVYDGYAAHNGTDYGWYDAVGNTFTTQTYGGYTITGAL